MSAVPATKYATHRGIAIAYQVLGEGPVDLLIIPGFISHVELAWEEPRLARCLRQLATFARVILMDKRGTGVSERVPVGALEDRIDDNLAVLDAVGSERAAVMAWSEGGPLSILFAASYPERVSRLVLVNTFARMESTGGFEDGMDPGMVDAFIEMMTADWGTGVGLELYGSSVADDPDFREWWARYQRSAASPSAVRQLFEIARLLDTRPMLSDIAVPTLVIQRSGDLLSGQQGDYLAAHIPGARLVTLPGNDHFYWVGDSDPLIGEVQTFLTGETQVVDPDKRMATIMFTDIVGSTARAAAIGDGAWLDLLEQHDRTMSTLVKAHRGDVVKTTGDGMVATFDGPARAVECAREARRSLEYLTLQVRVGLHAGEFRRMARDIRGVAVHVASRVMEHAGAGEVLVTGAVVDLVAGAGLRFEPRGNVQLKGLTGDWPLFEPL